MAGIAHEEDSAPEWFAAQFPNIGESLPAALCEGLTVNKQKEVVMSQEEKARFESCSPVITAADAALEAASEVLKDASADPWFHQKLMRAALEAALASIVIID